MQDLVSRIRKIIEYAAMSDRAFARACGINQPTLFNQLKGLRSVSLDTVTAVAAAFPEVSRDWLLLGEGEMSRRAPGEADRIAKLVGTIATLQDVIDAKDAEIAALKSALTPKQIKQV